ncbi:acyl-CoA synthetase (AMP-forming)/AMP-acid ligase II [Sphingomonas jinjuensis]|uniref:3-methylmercaptopropionyl-CoA ligase n=1 Tax=Sphingomonas jinjuensis TaxID=535907 RepID=A0A840FBR3_9SPHN|nr:acyl-CoA synthetase (AMP-forming)/AMP-acid ligase II [Sphingomonas jinjuensis]
MPELTLGGMIEANALARPEATALVAAGETMTFAALAARARSLAAAFAALGLRHQDRVAVLGRNSLGYCEVYAACERGGFIIATVNFRGTAQEVLHVLRDSDARLVIFDREYADLIRDLRTQLASDVRYVVIGPAIDDAVSLDDLASPEPAPIFYTDDLVYIIYTSGTTGVPKGCLIGQRGEVEKARITAGDVRMSSADRILLTMPLFHIGARAMLNAQHWAGGTVIVHRDFSAAEVLSAVERERVTILHLAPTMVQMLLEEDGGHAHDLSSLRAIVYSASAMPPTVLAAAIQRFGPIFYQIYGLTEGIGTILSPEHHVVGGDERQTKRLKSIGVPSASVTVRIADDQGAPLPDGEPGEMLLRTPTAMRGYWNQSAATIDTLRDGWLRTGDLGYRDSDGFLYLVDRKKDMVVSGGENIYSREVENALTEHPAVKEAAVIGVPDPKWGEAVRAVVVLREGNTVTAEDLIGHVRARIASYKKPRDVVFIDVLPKMANGKIDKKTIRAVYGAYHPVSEGATFGQQSR